MHTTIHVEDLHRHYRTTQGIFRRREKHVTALKGLSFTVGRGEIFGLLGPNGAGKTTTIKILTTLLAPSGGTARVLDLDCFGQERALRRRINFILGGERNLYWRLSAWDNLSYFFDLYGLPEKGKKARIESLLQMVDLHDRAHHKVETFSKGMKQRLQIARGLINDPEVVFLDEPTIGLDPVGARTLRDIIRTQAGLGKTIVLTTHYMQEADELCDRIAVINHGELLALDTPSSLKQRFNQGEGSLEDAYLAMVGGH